MPKRSTSSPTPDRGSRPSGPRHTADEGLLAPRPAGERQAFTSSDPWRALRILGEFVEGFDALSDLDWAVTIFGSARTEPDRSTRISLAEHAPSRTSASTGAWISRIVAITVTTRSQSSR